MNKYEIYICESCGKECEIVEETDEYAVGPDHFYGGAKWETVDVLVSSCCKSDYKKGCTDENGVIL